MLNELEAVTNKWERWILSKKDYLTVTKHEVETLVTQKIAEPGISTLDKMGLMKAEVEVLRAISTRDGTRLSLV